MTCIVSLTVPAPTNASSSPKVPLASRTYVLRDTVMSESPRNTLETTMMVSGSPSGVIILALGSNSVFHMVLDLGNNRWASNTACKTSKIPMPQRASPPYNGGESRSHYKYEAIMAGIGDIVSIATLLALQLVFPNRLNRLGWGPVEEETPQDVLSRPLCGPTVSRGF